MQQTYCAKSGALTHVVLNIAVDW